MEEEAVFQWFFKFLVVTVGLIHAAVATTSRASQQNRTVKLARQHMVSGTLLLGLALFQDPIIMNLIALMSFTPIQEVRAQIPMVSYDEPHAHARALSRKRRVGGVTILWVALFPMLVLCGLHILTAYALLVRHRLQRSHAMQQQQQEEEEEEDDAREEYITVAGFIASLFSMAPSSKQPRHRHRHVRADNAGMGARGRATLPMPLLSRLAGVVVQMSIGQRGRTVRLVAYTAELVYVAYTTLNMQVLHPPQGRAEAEQLNTYTSVLHGGVVLVVCVLLLALASRDYLSLMVFAAQALVVLSIALDVGKGNAWWDRFRGRVMYITLPLLFLVPFRPLLATSTTTRRTTPSR